MAPDLVGCSLLVDGVGGVIVEVERYQQDDPASHSFRGPSGRAAVMFGAPGHLYVYRSYGLHWCVNLVCEPEGRGAAVLLRALRPTHGLDVMAARRGGLADRLLCAGPGRLCAALGIDGYFDAVLGAGDLTERKPHPLPLQHLADGFGVDIAQCLMVGDSAADAGAAIAAGAPLVLVGYGYRRDFDLHGCGALAVIERFEELLELR